MVEHGISGRVRNPSAYVSRMVMTKEREEKCCRDNEEQWVDDDWTEDKVGGQCIEETVMGEDGEQETEVAGEGEHGDQFAGRELVNMRTARAGIGQRSVGMITPSDGAWTRRGATMVGRPIATTRGITTAVTTTMRKATATTTKRLGIEVEPSVPPWMLVGIRRRGGEGCRKQPLLFHFCHALVRLSPCSPDLTRHREHSLLFLDSFRCDCVAQVADQKSAHSSM